MSVDTSRVAVIKLMIAGANALKADQLGPATNGFVRSNGCVAVEPQGLIDGINHPEWGVNQIYGPDTGDFESKITYKFSTIGKQ